MIPFFTYQTIPLGPLDIQVWGLFVALGIGLSLWVGHRWAARHHLDGGTFLDMAAWALVAGVFGSRLMYVIAYQPGYYWHDPAAMIRLWDGGLSWFGGVLGAALAIWLFARKQGIPVLGYLHAAAFALPWGYAVGRIGCFLIHDHIGITVGNCQPCAWLAVDFPGAAKLDMGLLHVFLGLAIGIAFLVVERRSKGRMRPYLFLLMLAYGAARFPMDYLRYWDAPFAEQRYAGLTPAQYLSVPMAVAGLWYLIYPPKPPSVWVRLRGWWQRIPFDRLPSFRRPRFGGIPFRWPDLRRLKFRWPDFRRPKFRWPGRRQ